MLYIKIVKFVNNVIRVANPVMDHLKPIACLVIMIIVNINIYRLLTMILASVYLYAIPLMNRYYKRANILKKLKQFA